MRSGNCRWVDKVEVKRVWPDAIDIRVGEKTAFARWGENSLITEQGVIFSPRNIDQFLMLPKVSGPERQEQKVLEIMKGVYDRVGRSGDGIEPSLRSTTVGRGGSGSPTAWKSCWGAKTS